MWNSAAPHVLKIANVRCDLVKCKEFQLPPVVASSALLLACLTNAYPVLPWQGYCHTLDAGQQYDCVFSDDPNINCAGTCTLWSTINIVTDEYGDQNLEDVPYESVPDNAPYAYCTGGLPNYVVGCEDGGSVAGGSTGDTSDTGYTSSIGDTNPDCTACVVDSDCSESFFETVCGGCGVSGPFCEQSSSGNMCCACPRCMYESDD